MRRSQHTVHFTNMTTVLYIFTILFLCLIVCTKSELKCELDNDVLNCVSDQEYNILTPGIITDNENAYHIYLINCKITTLEQGAFDGLPYMETLDFSLNNVTQLSLGVFVNAHTILRFNASHNSIETIQLGFFGELTGITTLDLSYNKLTDIELGLFDAIESVENLDLSHNNIVGLPLGVFDKPNKIINLDLSYNKMGSLPLGIFDSLKDVQNINLQYSEFTVMPSGIFDQSKKLISLNLSGNKISSIPNQHFNDLKRLKYLDLSNNAFLRLRPNTFSSLKMLKLLNLSRNMLADISATTNLPLLSSLDVSYNRIQNLPLYNVTMFKTLNITGNRFTYLSDEIISKQLKTIKLHKNPWQCSCLSQLLNALRGRNVDYYSKEYFEGRKPLCVSLNDKSSTCVKDGSIDQQLYNVYTRALAKYSK